MAKFHEVIKGELYFSGQPDVASFARYGVDIRRTAVLAVCKKQTDPAVVIRAAAYRHLPIPDGKTYRRVLFEDATGWVRYYLSTGTPVLVHCLYGKNRSATVAALVLYRQLRYRDETVEMALETIRRIRPGAIDNPVMEEGLLSS